MLTHWRYRFTARYLVLRASPGMKLDEQQAESNGMDVGQRLPLFTRGGARKREKN